MEMSECQHCGFWNDVRADVSFVCAWCDYINPRLKVKAVQRPHSDTPEAILQVAREVCAEGHPLDTRIARLASYVKETLEGMGIGGDPKCAGYPPCMSARGCGCQLGE